MALTGLFVGRTAEREAFERVLASPEGQVVLVVGPAGMGKSSLLDQFVRDAESHPTLTCRAVERDVTPDDRAIYTIELLVSDAEAALNEGAGLVSVTPQGRRQLRAVFEALVPKGDKLAKLRDSLRPERKPHVRDQFRALLRALSENMDESGRVVFVIDPNREMHRDSADTWRSVVEDLPPRIKFVFAQRPHDALVSNDDFAALPNLVRIPDDRLDVLSEAEVEELLLAAAPGISQPIDVLRTAMARYGGYPFAIDAALRLIDDGLPIDELPDRPEPTRFAKAQWRRIGAEHGADAVRLFEALAVLEVPVPTDVIVPVAGLESAALTALFMRPFLDGLVNRDADAIAIYHDILAGHIRGKISADDAKAYHEAAITVYRDRLKPFRERQEKPDDLAARRLAVHVRQAEGHPAFVAAFVDECTVALARLGLSETVVELTQEAMTRVDEQSIERAVLTGNLGIVLKTRGDLDGAEAMQRKALEINDKLGRAKGMANAYGNLGVVLQIRGDLDGAEAMQRAALEIDEKLGRLEGMASHYGNLGVIYQTRGDLDQAEAMFRKSLEIEENLGGLEGMATDYGNLANVLLRRGDLDGAEAMYRKSLEIDEKLGRLEGMAIEYGNLGIVQRKRGDLDGAVAYWTKARDLYERVGIPDKVQLVQSWIEDARRGGAS